MRTLSPLLLALIGCSPLDLDSILWQCATPADCGSGFVCRNAICEPADRDGRNGVFADRVVIGLIAPIEAGPMAGAELRDGLQAAFAAENAAGGIHARALDLDVRDDGYDPAAAAAHAEAFASARGALVVVGGIGDHVAGAIEPPLVRARIAHVSLGRAEALRPAIPRRYLFTPWAGSEAELQALIESPAAGLSSARSEDLALFTQWIDSAPDAHGEALLAALAEVVGARPAVFGHARGSTDVAPAVSAALDWLGQPRPAPGPTGIVLGGEPIANARFARAVLDALDGLASGAVPPSAFGLPADLVDRLDAVTAVAFLAPSGLGKAPPPDEGDCAPMLRAHPLAHLEGSETARRFGEALATLRDAPPTPTAFEGWVIGRIIIEALHASGRDLNAETFVDALEALSVDLDAESQVAFSSDRHIGWDGITVTRIDATCREMRLPTD